MSTHSSCRIETNHTRFQTLASPVGSKKTLSQNDHNTNEYKKKVKFSGESLSQFINSAINIEFVYLILIGIGKIFESNIIKEKMKAKELIRRSTMRPSENMS